MKKYFRKQAFTLAEVMITMGIIGVVAAILMPTLIREVTLRSDSSREANIAQKITKAMENMSVNGEFVNFEDTEAFVNVLQKYLKIAKRCDSNHLADCWPTDKVRGSKGETIDVSSAKLGTDLHVKGNTTDNVGLVLADGGSIILTYDNSFDGFSPDTLFTAYNKELPVGVGKTKEFPYSSSVTAPIDYVVDVNGGMHPNRETSFGGEYYDIRSFRAASFGIGTCPGFIYNNICFKILEQYSPINCKNPVVDVDYKKYCVRNSLDEDYISAAEKACEDIDMTLFSNLTYIKNMQAAGKLESANHYYMNTRRYDASATGWFYNNNPSMAPAICVKQ